VLDLDDATRRTLAHVASARGTPCYVYFADEARERARRLARALAGRFEVSFAVKANPNRALLAALRGSVDGLDVSSVAEIERAVAAGHEAGALTFSGPAKRAQDLERALALSLEEIVCESEREVEAWDRIARARGRRLPFLVRVNPRTVPRGFAMVLAGRASQFGIDEEDLDPVLGRLAGRRGLDFAGFHVLAGTSSLDEEAIARCLGDSAALFGRLARAHDLRPRKLIFGSGFGIPYHPGERALDVDALCPRIVAAVDGAIRDEPRLSQARLVLELGRWLVGPCGYFLTTVIHEKRSRGVEIRVCDAGLNAHLPACGLFGQAIRRPWRLAKANARGDEPVRRYRLVGPLCTAVDTIALEVELHELGMGDVIAIGASGAYGLTASPIGFGSHPAPREYLVTGTGGAGEAAGPRVDDVSEEAGPPAPA